jgi:hypothetical protein
VLVDQRAQQEALNLTASRTFRQEAGGKDGGVVAKKSVTGAKEPGEITKRVVRNSVRNAVNHEKPRLIASRRR